MYECSAYWRECPGPARQPCLAPTWAPGVRVPTEPIPDVAETSAWADEHTVTFRLADPGQELAGARLAQDVRIPGDRLGFHRSGDGWELLPGPGIPAGSTAFELPSRPVPAIFTCGTIEENVHNNRLMVKTLRDRGYPATLHEVPDMHNYTAWRDAFDPYFTELLAQVGQ